MTVAKFGPQTAASGHHKIVKSDGEFREQAAVVVQAHHVLLPFRVPQVCQLEEVVRVVSAYPVTVLEQRV